MELGIIDLLMQHELLEVLSCIRLSLQCLESLNKQTNSLFLMLIHEFIFIEYNKLKI